MTAVGLSPKGQASFLLRGLRDLNGFRSLLFRRPMWGGGREETTDDRRRPGLCIRFSLFRSRTAQSQDPVWGEGGRARVTPNPGAFSPALSPSPIPPEARPHSKARDGWLEVALACDERDKAQELPHRSGDEARRKASGNVEAQPGRQRGAEWTTGRRWRAWCGRCRIDECPQPRTSDFFEKADGTPCGACKTGTCREAPYGWGTYRCLINPSPLHYHTYDIM